jgi:hypothetical protein
MDDWSLTVGVRYYPDDKLGDLDGPEVDATEFHQWVTSPSGGSVTDPANAKLILSSHYGPRPADPASANPTVPEVNKFFEALQNLVRKKKAAGAAEKIGRRLYLYFAGHGFMPPASKYEVAVLMANAEDPDALGHHILATAWAEMFYDSGYFQEVLLFVDACRNELKNAPRNVPFLTPLNDPNAKKNGRRFYAYAAKWDRDARERALHGGSRGVFTAALMAGLRGGAADPVTQEIRAKDLSNFLYQNTRQFLAEEERSNEEIDSEPEIQPPFSQRENFVIATVPNIPYPVRFEVPTAAAGLKLFVFKGNNVVASTEGLTAPSWSCIPLPCGAYKAALENGNEYPFEVKHPGFELGNDEVKGVNIVPL